MLTGSDLEEAKTKADLDNFMAYQEANFKMVQGIRDSQYVAETYSWVIEKTMKDGTHAFEFPSNLTEQQARDHADAILGDTPGVDSISIYRKIGTVRRVQTTAWEA